MTGPLFAQSLLDVKVEQLSEPASTKWGRDPFIRYADRFRATPKSPARPDFKVEGIITDGKRALAIINNGFYRKGDLIGDYVVEDIGRDSVQLVREDERLNLKIHGFLAEPTRTEDAR